MRKIKEDRDRLRFYALKIFNKTLPYSHRIEYHSTNTGVKYICQPVPDVKARKSSGYPWNNYVLWRGSRDLGIFKTCLDARLAAQRDYDEMRKRC